MAIAARIKSLKYRQFLILSKIFISRPLFILPTLKATKETVKVCDDLFQHRHHGHNRTNAFRHALWNFLICNKCYKVSKSEEKCASWAKKISDLHEKLSPNEELEKEMDLYNNRIGIDLFLNNPREYDVISVLQKMMAEAVPVKTKHAIENSGGKLVYIETEKHIVKEKFYKYIEVLQDSITSKLEEIEGIAKFREDIWEREEGGGGRTRVIENGGIFEKGGVNISAVHGPLAPAMQQYFKVGEVDFFACGLSLVLHPRNPMVPTVHANWRYFEMYDKSGKVIDQWFGGGQDLTPYYLFEEDATHFHKICKRACDSHDRDIYPRYKKQCDDYFWNSHRDEARGIGGLFFDYCKATPEMSIMDWYKFVTEVGDSFLEAYVPIVEKRKDLKFSRENRNWQEIRRGRYVEFNLVHDKGTLFGLKTNGRIESILMSLPPHVQWVYDHHPKPGSEEEELLKVLKAPKNWV